MKYFRPKFKQNKKKNPNFSKNTIIALLFLTSEIVAKSMTLWTTP